jgi:hypothetical protein
VWLIAGVVGSHAAIPHAPRGLALGAARILEALWRDIVLTGDEVEGPKANLPISESAPTGSTPLGRRLTENAATLGVRYASEVRRYYAPPAGR